ncbi:MAG: hypothetical protein JSR19_09505 [Proteobacteria bacterium]|nr:hypothetical protein [Pseudomonadota bacterium]HQR04110.1 LuxR C-terminal-related transcriptional regulator [Rhodocyclaceae bacterium]
MPQPPSSPAVEAPPSCTTETLNTLTTALYGGLLGRPWRAFLDHLRPLFHAHDVTLLLRFPSREDTGAVIFSADRHLLEAERSYATQFYAMDPFEGLRPGQVVAISDLVTPEAWRHSEFYREYVQPLGIEHVLAAEIRHDSGAACRLRISRTARTGDFSRTDRDTLALLVPHMTLAVGLQARLHSLESERGLLVGAVEKLSVGSVMLDREGRILWMNEVALRLLAGDHGLHVRDGRLKAGKPAEDAAIQARIRRALDHGRSAGPSVVEALSIGGGRHPALSVLIRPVAAPEEIGPGPLPEVAVFLRDGTGRAHASADLIRQLYDLTRAETAIAVHLADGLSLEEIADTLGVQLNTVRVHLRSIFAKTGADRQSALVRLLLNSVATLG